MERYRPIYHFIAPSQWMNDPNGPIFFDGNYHMFYQHNPNADEWGDIHWGHAVSEDLIHWSHWPIALAPSTERGEKHVYSGCCVVGDDGVPAILYTSVGEGLRNATNGPEQWMATSVDGMRSWGKLERNPVLTLEAHGALDVKEWRDPFVWRESDGWYMVLGGGLEGRGCALIYRSDNLRDWTFLNVLHRSERGESIWECPNLFRLGDKEVLVYSPNEQVRYEVGIRGNDHSFVPERWGTVDHGGWEGFYAPNSLIDPRGRRLMWGWMPEVARGEFRGNRGWAGMLSIPRVVTLSEDGGLRFEPAEELRALRGRHAARAPGELPAGYSDTGFRGRAAEFVAEFERKSARVPFGISVLRSPGGEEETVILFDPVTGTASIDRSRSSLAPEPHKSTLSGASDLGESATVRIHLFVDHSAIELFVNGTICISARVYPLRLDSDGAYLFTSEKGVRLLSFDAWELGSIRLD